MPVDTVPYGKLQHNGIGIKCDPILFALQIP